MMEITIGEMTFTVAVGESMISLEMSLNSSAS